MRPAVRFAMFAALVVSVSIALADSPAAPFPYVETTFDGTHYFKMLPGEPHPFDENARGEFYRVGEQKDELLWRTEGWFAFLVFLAGNGDHMVRMGPWSSGGEPATNDLAIAFYMKGQLVKSYSTKDLMPDPSKVRRSVSHYKWIKSITGLHELQSGPFGPSKMNAFTFTLVTLADECISFDAKTGKIVSRALLKKGTPQQSAGERTS